MKKIVLGCIGLCSVIVCETSLGAGVHIQGKEVKRIYPTRDTIFFRLKDDECIQGSQYYYFQFNETDNVGMYAAKNWYSMLLASAMAGKAISIKVPSCPTDGNIKIDYVFQDY